MEIKVSYGAIECITRQARGTRIQLSLHVYYVKYGISGMQWQLRPNLCDKPPPKAQSYVLTV